MLPLINLGTTDIRVSRMGLGTTKFGRNQQTKYPEKFALPSDGTIIDLFNRAKDLRINLIDTAPAYGTSEERIGKLLTDRQQWILCSKVGEEFIDGQSYFDFSAKTTKKTIERSLVRLQTDYLDIVLVHSNGEDKKIIEETAIFETLYKLKEAGVIRAFGMSTKTVDGGKLAVEYSDVVMVTYNPIETAEKEVLTYAEQHQKGVLIKKAFASGHLNKISEKSPIQTALQFIFQQPGVSSVISGTINVNHLTDNVRALLEVIDNR